MEIKGKLVIQGRKEKMVHRGNKERLVLREKGGNGAHRDSREKPDLQEKKAPLVDKETRV